MNKKSKRKQDKVYDSYAQSYWILCASGKEGLWGGLILQERRVKVKSESFSAVK